MNNDAIVQEMIDNNESCRVIEDNNGYIVKLRPSVIPEALKGKLSEADIADGTSIVKRQLELSNIKTSLYRQCDNVLCKAKDNCIFRAVPNGNTDADVLFLNKIPTCYETCNMSSHCDKNGIFLSLILSKMGVSRDAVYCTDMIKCDAQLDEQSYNECINAYIVNEIRLVSPKVIICNGLSVLKACVKSNVLIGLSLDVTYGKIYDARTRDNNPVKVIAMYDLSTVLQKTGDDYTRCKTELWSQILSAFKGVNEV